MSRAEAIRLAKNGIPPAVICERLGARRDTVSHWLWKARAEGEDIPRFLGGPRQRKPVTVEVPASCDVALRDLAAQHDTTPETLARRLIAEGLAKMEAE